jgi:hypothetical protein
MALAFLEDFDKPDVFPTTTTTKISVRFVQTLPLELPIQNQPMKTPQTPADNLIRLAAHLENFALPDNQIPLTLLSEKSDEAFSSVKNRNDNNFYVAARALNHRVPAPATTKSIPRRRKQLHIYENPLEGLRNTEFRMEAPEAKSVQLAGDFTEWASAPLDLVQSYDGTWFTIVPLLPGTYSYRFIVDGQWLDDPHCGRHVPNPFGSEDAVMSVD